MCIRDRLYVYFNQDTYTYVKTMTVILMVCYKVIDGFADVYEDVYKRQEQKNCCRSWDLNFSCMGGKRTRCV